MMGESRRYNCAAAAFTGAHLKQKLTVQDRSADIQCREDVRSLLLHQEACNGRIRCAWPVVHASTLSDKAMVSRL